MCRRRVLCHSCRLRIPCIEKQIDLFIIIATQILVDRSQIYLITPYNYHTHIATTTMAAPINPDGRIYSLWGDGEGMEGTDSYGIGGLHPVHIEDYLGEDGRFKVVHKLGAGGFATVWLCRDVREHKWRAVKILAARFSTEDCTELQVYRLFESLPMDADRLLGHGICRPLENFQIDGPNGRHECFVLPLLGGSIEYYEEDKDKSIGPDTSRDLCLQLVDAMAFLHSQTGICHGDFRPGNILYQLKKDVHHLSEKDIYDILGFPEFAEVRIYKPELHRDVEEDPGPHCPEYLVQYAGFTHKRAKELLSTSIAVVDFGVAYQVGSPPKSGTTGIPLGHAAPELVFPGTKSLGFGTDIWSLATTICSILQDDEGGGPFASDDERDLTLGWEELLGPLPQPYRAKYIAMGYYVVPGGEHDPVAQTIEDIIHWRKYTQKEQELPYCPTALLEAGLFKGYQVEVPLEEGETQDEEYRGTPHEGLKMIYRLRRQPDEVKEMMSMLRTMFRWMPEDRMMASEVRKYPYFKAAVQAQNRARSKSAPTGKPKSRSPSSRRQTVGSKPDKAPTKPQKETQKKASGWWFGNFFKAFRF